eukprot:1696908-Prymnesium_polylepis.1
MDVVNGFTRAADAHAPGYGDVMFGVVALAVVLATLLTCVLGICFLVRVCTRTSMPRRANGRHAKPKVS